MNPSKKSKVILVLGFFLGIFLIYIAFKGNSNKSPTELAELRELPFSISPKENGIEIEPTNFVEEKGEEKVGDPKTLGAVMIKVTSNGFVPKVSNALLNQKVTFVNETGVEISILEKIRKYEPFSGGLKIKPAGNYTFTATGPGLWTFIEEGSEIYGQLFVNRP